MLDYHEFNAYWDMIGILPLRTMNFIVYITKKG